MQTYLIAPVKQGKPQLTEQQRRCLNKAFTAREGKVVQIAIGDIEKSRSVQQNKFLWGCVYKLIAEQTGYTEEELNEVFKHKFLPRKYVNLGGEEIETRKSTTKLSTVEFEAYIERIRAFAAEELQVEIPLPNQE